MTIPLIPLPWKLAATAIVLLATAAASYTKGHHDGHASLKADWNDQQLRQAHEFAGRLAEANKELQRIRAADRAKDATYEATMRDVDRRHHAAVASLRSRPERAAVPASGAGAEACQGATGAALSRSDASFLVGLAARADELRAALERCQDGDIALEGARMDH
jgi:hypothetical protein